MADTQTQENLMIQCQFTLQLNQFLLDVNFEIPSQGIIGLFGRSGSGKTTLLRCIAGLEKADLGSLQFKNQSWQDQNHFLPTHKRPIGYVFQEASLFPHLTVLGNLQYAQKRANQSTVIKFEEALKILNIQHLLEHQPHQLSGGERQRVAIARALLINPSLLLMDEPLASLDAEHKQEILPYLERLHQELTIPIIYVSHSIDEIARLADHLIVINKGSILVNDSITEALARLDFPVNLGDEQGVVVSGKIVERDQQWQLMRVEFDGGDIWIRDTSDAVIGQGVRLRILAKDVSLALERHQSSILNVISGSIDQIVEDTQSGSALVRVAAGNSFITAKLTLRSVSQLSLKRGVHVWAQVKSVALV